jgi:hypothetical protein
MLNMCVWDSLIGGGGVHASARWSRPLYGVSAAGGFTGGGGVHASRRQRRAVALAAEDAECPLAGGGVQWSATRSLRGGDCDASPGLGV